MLRESDEAVLREKNYNFEVVKENGFICIVLRGFHFPPAYIPREADLMIRLPSGFPSAHPDMFWTSPDVKLISGKYPLQCANHQTYLGKDWQRWSRHWNHPWRAGTDGLNTYLAAIINDIVRGI
jgi:hypothetical protein